MSAVRKRRKQEKKKKTAHLWPLLYVMKVCAVKSGCQLGWRTAFRSPGDPWAVPVGVNGPEEKAAPPPGGGKDHGQGRVS